MRLDAHPLIVAVALGLLGPAALAVEDDEPALPWVADGLDGADPVAPAVAENVAESLETVVIPRS